MLWSEDNRLAIHEADVHLAGVQVDSAVEFCGGGIILHRLIAKSAVRHRVKND